MATPILTRLYSPDDFAAAAVFNGLLVTIAGFGSWRLDWMIPNAADRDDAKALMVVGVATAVCTSVVAAVAIPLLLPDMQSARALRILGQLALLVPVGLFAFTIRDLLNGWFLYETDLRVPSNARSSQALCRAAVTVGIGLAGSSAFGLIAGQIAGAVASLVMMSRGLRGQLAAVRRLSGQQLRRVRSHGSQATLSVAVTLVRHSTQLILPVLLLEYFSGTEVGWYSVMQRVAVGPLGIITTALGQSFWAEAAQLAREDGDRLRTLYYRTTKRLLVLSVPLVVVCVCGPLFVGQILGRESWAGSGYVLQCLAPLVVGTLVVGPLNHLVVHRRQALQLLIDACRLVLVIGIVVGSSALGIGFLSVVFLTSMAYLVTHAVLFVVHCRILR